MLVKTVDRGPELDSTGDSPLTQISVSGPLLEDKCICIGLEF
jgi:hypothetical protein